MMAEGEPSDAPQVNLLDVILDEPLVERAREAAEHAGGALSLRREWGADPVQERGIFLVLSGPPGSGKTTLVRALASHLKLPVSSTTGPSMASSSLGSAEALTTFLSTARKTPTLCVIDESEALFSPTSPGLSSSLRAIDLHGQLVVLITRDPSLLDRGALGGTVEHIRCRFPDPEQRQSIWEIHLPPDVPLEADVDVSALGRRFPMSGGEISAAVHRAIHLAVALEPAAPKIGQGLLVEVCESWATHGFPESLTEPDEPCDLAQVIAHRERVEDNADLGAGLSGRRAFLVLVDGPEASAKARRLVADSGHRHRCLTITPDAPSMSRQLDEAIGRRAVVLIEDAEMLFPPQDPALDTDTSRRERRRGLELMRALADRNVTALFTTYAFGAVGDALTKRISWRHAITDPGPDDRAAAWSALWPREVPTLAPEDLQVLAARWELSTEQISHVIRRACYQAKGGDLTPDLIQQACEQEYRTAGKVTRRLPPQETEAEPTTT